ncbi:MAG: class II fumarate hydratase [Nitrospirae bacterium]|nr:class II fumarate hydratase [Nitrospirota bacterium]
MKTYRIEKDSLGEVKVPEDALYGPQTQRAVDNFPVSGIRFPRVFIRALGMIKTAAAETNKELGLLFPDVADAIQKAADEVSQGRWDDHFPVDIFQTGSGTSTHMNTNEVIANRAISILKGKSQIKSIHPNDHVNMGQSSNDVIPTAIHVSVCLQLHELVFPALRHLKETLDKRSAEFSDVVKTGRTHLMDAVPIRMSHEISGWSYQIAEASERIMSCLPRLLRLAIGGTAVGTGMNTHPEFGKMVARKLSGRTGLAFVETDNHFAAQAGMDSATELSGHLKTAATSLFKIANDLRLMNSGPSAGLAEIVLPPLQPGSSIMPGKINPVICESAMMACSQVIGNDVAVSIGNASGNFELNAMLPLIAHNLLQSLSILGNSARLLADKALSGFILNRDKIADIIQQNPALVTALTPVLGYDKAAEIAKRAYAEKRAIKDVAAEMTNLSPDEIDGLIDPWLKGNAI